MGHRPEHSLGLCYCSDLVRGTLDPQRTDLAHGWVQTYIAAAAVAACDADVSHQAMLVLQAMAIWCVENKSVDATGGYYAGGYYAISEATDFTMGSERLDEELRELERARLVERVTPSETFNATTWRLLSPPPELSSDQVRYPNEEDRARMAQEREWVNTAEGRNWLDQAKF